MKNTFKKQIEHEISEVIKKALSGHNSHAIDKTKKAIKQASKLVAKKFSRTIKNLSQKKKDSTKNVKHKPQPAKSITAKTMNTKKAAPVHSSNGAAKHKKVKVALSGAVKRKSATSLHKARQN